MTRTIGVVGSDYRPVSNEEMLAIVKAMLPPPRRGRGVRRKNLRHITPPPVFSNDGGYRVCSNRWAFWMMEQTDRRLRLARWMPTRLWVWGPHTMEGSI